MLVYTATDISLLKHKTKLNIVLIALSMVIKIIIRSPVTITLAEIIKVNNQNVQEYILSNIGTLICILYGLDFIS